MKAIVTVAGVDKRGIIAAVSTELFAMDVNILDINQTVMQEFFTMTCLVELDASELHFEEISGRLGKLGEKIRLSVRIQREDIFTAMHRI
ncbi:MAG: ACT domain-containing protein [Oscillospiraceae bacterium]|jgi:ACT domain-containing protein|nr:ACT domain-containing protein [Oscillospiraceae bacterium]